MKKILFILLITVLTVGCSKNDDPKTNTFNPLLTEYNVDNVFKDNSNVYSQTLNESLIYFSGQLKDYNEIGLFIFNIQTKTKLIGVVPLKESTVTFNKPYGGKETVIINYYVIDSFIDNGAIVLALSINNQTNYPRYFCFIKDGRVIKTTTVSDTFSISNPLIIKWKDNFIIQDSSTSVDPNISKPKVFLYSSTGEKILDVVNKNFEIMYDFEIINDFEGIAITENINNHLIWRFDLRKETALWYILTYFPELDRPRFDETKLISKTTTHFTYEISYTEYSGTKGTIKFKVNIETGEVEYL